MIDHYRKARKQHWVDRCIAVHNFHVERLRIDSEWTMRNTANELDRSLGSVSQDIKIAKWLKTHENKIRSFRRISYALEWIKEMENGRKIELA